MSILLRRILAILVLSHGVAPALLHAYELRQRDPRVKQPILSSSSRSPSRNQVAIHPIFETMRVKRVQGAGYQGDYLVAEARLSRGGEEQREEIVVGKLQNSKHLLSIGSDRPLFVPTPTRFVGFDLGKTLIHFNESETEGYYYDGAIDYLEALKKRSIHRALIVNDIEYYAPVDPYARFEFQLSALKQFVQTSWTDREHDHFDWDAFDSVILSTRLIVRKPDPFLFHGFNDMANANATSGVFIGEDASELAIASQIGMPVWQTKIIGKRAFYVPIESIDTFR